MIPKKRSGNAIGSKSVVQKKMKTPSSIKNPYTKKQGGVFSGRISGISQFQVRVERLSANICIAYVQKAKKKEEAFGGPIVSALNNESIRDECKITQVFKRRDPESSTGQALKCRAGSIYDWNLFAYIGDPDDEEPMDVIDWGNNLVDVFNRDEVVSGYTWPVHFSLTADETKTPLRKLDDVMADGSVVAILDGKFDLRHPRVRQTLDSDEWKERF